MGETAPLLILAPYTKNYPARTCSTAPRRRCPTMINQDRSDYALATARRAHVGRRPHPDPPRPAAQPHRPGRRALRPRVTEVQRKRILTMAKRIDVSDLNVYYGAFKAVEGVSMTVEPRSVTAFIGPSGCGKSTFLRTLNRMHEVIPGGRVEGKVMLDDQDLYATLDRPGDRAPHRRHGLPAAQPVPDDVDLRQRRGRPAAQRREEQERRSTASSSGRCTARTSGTRSRTGSTSPAPACPAASSSGCASPAPSRWSRRCCSWTSRARRSTRSRRWPSRT